mmetsp:Transcript_103701/g.260063  ORF Transcript_103701/g.260063 Transcript_103701/m.260063 type:complete len:438 (+) Transcript_103701:890-2203(+)
MLELCLDKLLQLLRPDPRHIRWRRARRGHAGEALLRELERLRLGVRVGAELAPLLAPLGITARAADLLRSLDWSRRSAPVGLEFLLLPRAAPLQRPPPLLRRRLRQRCACPIDCEVVDCCHGSLEVLLRELTPPSQHLLVLPRVSLCHVHCVVAGKGEAIRQFFSPTPLVDQGGVESLLARVRMQPALETIAIDLRPDMVRPIVHVSRLVAQRAAYEREAIRPLPAAPLAPLEQLPRIVVAREAGLHAAHIALCNLDGAGTVTLLLLVRRRCPHRLRVRRPAVLAPWAVRPLEEKLLVPQEDLAHEGHVVALGGPALAHEPIQGADGDVIQRLTLQPAVFVLLCPFQPPDLVLQPGRQVAQLCLQHRQVLLLHHPGRWIRPRRAADLERVLLRRVPQHDDLRWHVGLRPSEEHVCPERPVPAVACGRLDAHHASADG